MKMGKLRLHLGCGKRVIPGFVNIDIADFKHIHHKTSIDKLDMIEDDSVDLIYCSHAFEYFDRQEAVKVLDEWYRVLKDGGILRLAVPDFHKLVKLYLAYDVDLEDILGPLYGRMEICTPRRKVIYHRTVYDFTSLRNLLRSAGFIGVFQYDWRRKIHKDYDDHSQAYYPHMDKENGILISLNVEGRKDANRDKWLKDDQHSYDNVLRQKDEEEQRILKGIEEEPDKEPIIEEKDRSEEGLEEEDKKYNPWPLGQIPVKFRRNEINTLKVKGYDIDDARDAVTIFENKMARFVGSKYAVAVSSCTDALFLCLKYLRADGTVTIPSRTYCSVPMSIIHAGCKVQFENLRWMGLYQLKPYAIYDASLKFGRGMYIKNSLFCMSFQIKKRLPIGKGGMIFTDDVVAAKWLRAASFEGRHIDVPYDEDHFEMIGWNMYMTPEDAARGILIFDQLGKNTKIAGGWHNYTDLSKQKIFG